LPLLGQAKNEAGEQDDRLHRHDRRPPPGPIRPGRASPL
jgi:hypothetical protein